MKLSDLGWIVINTIISIPATMLLLAGGAIIPVGLLAIIGFLFVYPRAMGEWGRLSRTNMPLKGDDQEYLRAA